MLEDPHFALPLALLLTAILGVLVIAALQTNPKKPTGKSKVSVENIIGGTAFVKDEGGHEVRRSTRCGCPSQSRLAQALRLRVGDQRAGLS